MRLGGRTLISTGSKIVSMLKQDEMQVHELRDLEVQEVSLVDRPANKRKFLIVKRAEADQMAKGAELKKDGEGGLAPADESHEDLAPEPTGSEEESPAPEDADFEEVELGELVLPEDVIKALGGSLMRAAKRLTALAQAVEGAEKGDGEVPPALMRQISAIARTLGGMGGSSDDAGKGKDEEKAKKEEEPATVEQAVENILGDVEKAGRKMSRGRLKQLRAAREALDKLLSEVDDEAKGDAKKSADPAVTELKSQVEALLSATSDLKTIVKSQSDELKRLKSGRPERNSGIVEDDDSHSVKRTVWPTNFNDEEVPEEDLFR